MGWFESVEHSRWLSEEMRALLRHGHAAMRPTGFGYFKSDGSVDTERPVDLAITARMTYAYSLGVLMGIPGSRKFCDHGVSCLRKYFEDPQFGGWYSEIRHEPDADEHGIPWDEAGARKWQYGQAFVVLAASAAAIANRPGAHELLGRALAGQEEHWLDPDTGLVRDGATRDWSQFSDYGGMNSLMHTIEAYLAASEAQQDPSWLDAAERMLRFVYQVAADHDWRVPEHYTADWTPDLDYSKDAPDTPYYPYGFVIGHGMELSRLALQAHAGLTARGRTDCEYLKEMSEEIFERSRTDGWRRNGYPGFIYSVDFDGVPVLEDHLQWVVSEGICATAFLRHATLSSGAPHGEAEAYEHSYRSWLDYLNDYMQLEPGVFVRALSPDNVEASDVVSSRPDIYHPLQALLAARLPVWPPFASALAHDLLDKPLRQPTDSASKAGRGWPRRR